jgi:predicted nucleic acid-binding protein
MEQELVLDTDVVSILFKQDQRVSFYASHIQHRHCFISFASIAELDQWAAIHRWGPARRTRLERHVEQFTVIYPDRIMCGWWAEASFHARRNGRPIAQHDAWIAATTLAMALPLVTNNPRDYSGIYGLTLITDASHESEL